MLAKGDISTILFLLIKYQLVKFISYPNSKFNKFKFCNAPIFAKVDISII